MNPAGFEPRIPRVPDSGPVVPCVSFPRLTCELMHIHCVAAVVCGGVT